VDAVALEALRDEFGNRWAISRTPSRRWEAIRQPHPYEVVYAQTAEALREVLLQREHEHRE
jgi:hypothetical protein